jgi:carboxypeptidase Taq
MDENWTVQRLLELSTQVEPGLIRVDADECTYPAHIILRYEMEQQLIDGVMSVDDIPEAWDAGMGEMLGLSTAGNFRDGCMQDVHWPSGGVGYFPTYTLGAIAAAQFKAAMLRDIPAVEQQIAEGDFVAMKTWLRDKIWSQGSRYDMQDLMVQATGKPLDVEDFKSHLNRRYLDQ